MGNLICFVGWSNMSKPFITIVRLKILNINLKVDSPPFSVGNQNLI